MHTINRIGRAVTKKITTLLTAVVVGTGLASCAEFPSRGETSSLSEEGSANMDSHPTTEADTKDLGLPTSAPLVGPEPGKSSIINLASGRKFILHMPASYQPGKKWPVVLAFHGWKETAGMMEGYTEMDAAEAIMVYPYGKDGAWAPAPYAKTTGTEDIQFARDIVDSLRATYAVDDDRIFATGMSNGGGFAAYLGCQMPDVFTSVATVSAAYYKPIHESCKDEPVGRLDMHGTLDPVVGYYGGTRHKEPYESVPDVVTLDAKRNRCEGELTTERLANNALLIQWELCEDPVQHIRIGGGRHVWPGGTYDNASEVGKGFATDKVLDFFAIPGRPADMEEAHTVETGTLDENEFSQK
ncbi:alpha/beta hydrolase family esterase [Corynebacterium ammoniagenes]|uniref:Esterase n=1 Tax=Corynebacterium ammoniagenes DSM 20306 TaxID=649754 RepID=A0ABN0AHK8_CORAM|nr:alpha/beta hydrolase-fold protein [Corynebacterium ammoniagenes]APT82577.1 esterase [Corynebacterium ammoniagenes DSM 20306]AQS73648.1 esterase [Corynebacterium ammoniagenes]EFG82307.1 putative esterase [Corynebacterium ammoniagenes DSM 20306]